MNYRHLGRSGLQVSELSLGSWVTFHNQVDVDSAVDCMSTAYDAGVNFFDNAESYADGKSEEVMGAALKKLGWRRSSYVISTKYYWGLHEGVNEVNTLNRKRLMEAIDGSLMRFDMEYIDLLFCHRSDPTTPIEETVWAMHNIIERGKAFYWGTSEWPAADVIAAIEIAERHHLHKPVMEQPEYNMLTRERFEKEYARLFKDYGYGSTIWSPLKSGLLTGKYNNGLPAGSRGMLQGFEWLQPRLTNGDSIRKVVALQDIATELGCSMAQLALAWCLKNPNVSTVITGASRVSQVYENMKALDVVEQLEAGIMEKIEAILQNRPED
ncbi:MAG TPA: aldo/keto reductase [Anaerolineales bacterium]|jgi:voltage-dependent potassium channel beta subunit